MRAQNAAPTLDRNDATLRAYLRDVTRHPRLTASAERQIDRRIAAGGEDATRARGELVRANLALVVHVAKRYRANGLALLDLVQEGNIGLMVAAEKYDPAHGAKFSTHATWWIRHHIGRAIDDKARVIRIPVGLATAARKAARTASKLGAGPMVDEIAARAGLSLARTAAALGIPAEPIALEVPRGEGERTPLDVLGDGREGADDALEGARQVAALRAAVARLSEPARTVVAGRYGLDGEGERSHRAIAEALGVSPEHVRQVERRALEQLRATARRKGE